MNNEATAFCDLLAEYYRSTKQSIGAKESYEDYDTDEWQQTTLRKGQKSVWRDQITTEKGNYIIYGMDRKRYDWCDEPWADDHE